MTVLAYLPVPPDVLLDEATRRRFEGGMSSGFPLQFVGKEGRGVKRIVKPMSVFTRRSNNNINSKESSVRMADDRKQNNNPMNNRPRRPNNRDLLNKRRPSGPQPPNSGKPGGKIGWPLGHRIAFIILLITLGFFMWKQMNSEKTSYAEVTYTDFTKMVKENLLDSAEIRNGTFYGKFKSPQVIEKNGEKVTFEGIEVEIGDFDQAFLKNLVDQGINLKIRPEKTWMNLLISTLPWVLLFGIWLFFLRQMQGGSKGVFSFGKSKAKLMAENQPKVTFDDVAGVEEAKTELEEIIDFLKDPRKFQRLGGKIPKGALLVGPPGTGKTLLARAVAGEAGVPFFSMSGSDFVEMFVGVGASRVRDLFEQGKTSAPCIIFIDEIDAVGRQRGAGIGGGHDEREQTLNQLLVEMDGFESNDGVILIAATNRPDVLDPALLRPGRFDRQIVVDWPDAKAREKILMVHAKKIHISPKVDLESVAKGTPGMTGADLANVVNEAALLAARLDRSEVMMADFEEAKDKVLMGAERRSMVINDEEKRLTAYHEAGHVLVSKYVPNADPVHKVSIIPRGRALGLTHFLPSDEKHNWSQTYCIGKLTGLLGGRAAEMVRFGDITNGASNDIENATNLARKMVCEWGMSKRLGPLAFGKKDHEIFLGRELATHKDYSEETAVAIDQEVRRLVETALQNAESVVREHTDQLEALAEQLLKREMLAGPEIDQIMNSAGSAPQNQPPRSTSKPSRRRRRSPKKGPKPNDAPASAERADTGVDAQKPEQPDESDERPADEPQKDGDDKSKRPPKKSDRRGRRGGRKSESPDDKKADGDKEAKKDQGDKKKDKKKKDGGTSGDDGDQKRRTRLIRLKTGGRQRVIRKAPAQKIRKIN